MDGRFEKKFRKFIRCINEMRLRVPERPDLVRELKEAIAALPALPERGASAPEDAWLSNRRRFRQLLRDDNPMKFLDWDVVKGTMFVRDADYIATELGFLQSRPDWHGRWQQAVQESPVGRPRLSWRYPASSGNLLHNAYHLARFEHDMGGVVTATTSVFEFGGGYGSMCRLFQNLNFRGRYLIFDLPEFSLLQRFYLKALGFEVLTPGSFRQASSGIACVSDYCDFTSLIGDCFEPQTSMFIATWSLSEAPLDLRERILSLVHGFSKMLIGYQKNFEGADNIAFFDKFSSEISDSSILHREIDHLRDNYYIFKDRAA